MTIVRTGEFGVYVHIPFCAHRCDYCAFATWTDRDHLVDAYVDAVVTDIERRVAAGMRTADTVFVGGGTPTRIDPSHIARIIAAIPVSDRPEINVKSFGEAPRDFLRQGRFLPPDSFQDVGCGIAHLDAGVLDHAPQLLEHRLGPECRHRLDRIGFDTVVVIAKQGDQEGNRLPARVLFESLHGVRTHPRQRQ